MTKQYGYSPRTIPGVRRNQPKSEREIDAALYNPPSIAEQNAAPNEAPSTPFRAPRPLCGMCGKDGTQVTLLKSADGRSFRCRRCHHAVCIEVYKAEAHKKLEQLSLSLPRSINDDDASMLARAKEPVREWYRSWSRTTMLSVLITGLPGEGKTLPVAARIRALANEAVEEYANGKGASELFDWVSGVYFVRAYDLAEASHEYKAGCPEIERAKRATLLVIDDLGLERAGHEQVFMNVVDHRIGARLPTWATSGFSVDALTERYSQAFVRRICERGTGKLIDLFRASARKLEAVR